MPKMEIEQIIVKLNHIIDELNIISLKVVELNNIVKLLKDGEVDERGIQEQNRDIQIE